LLTFFFFFCYFVSIHNLHSFPTRRSSDQILLDKLIICSILFHCSSSVRLLPSSVLANPHCGESNKRSAGKCSFASSTLCVIVLPSSSAGVFDVTSPSTTCVFSSLIFSK